MTDLIIRSRVERISKALDMKHCEGHLQQVEKKGQLSDTTTGRSHHT